MRSAAADALARALGPQAQFRDGQLRAIEAVVADRGRVLVVQRTGWGKSAVYFIATRLLRDQGAGPTVIVSPLLALMRDQVRMADRLGLRALTINSSNRDDWPLIEEQLTSGVADVLLISPERLNNRDFRTRLLIPVTRATGLLVIDEAHCISDWGHDFRPDYRRLLDILHYLPTNAPVLATTATANDRVVRDVRHQLGDAVTVIRGPLARDSLWLSAARLDSQPERLAWLAQHLPDMPGSGIVYCLTVADTERVAAWLLSQGIACEAYSGETPADQRLDIEKRLLTNQVKAVAATSALSMGFDKPDVGFIVHFQTPSSPIFYYQQIGRAGRGTDRAEIVLLAGSEDEAIWDYFTRTGLPVQSQAESVVATLADAGDWMTLRDLEARVNMGQNRLRSLMKILDVEGAVEQDPGRERWRRSIRPWTFDAERYAVVELTRRQEMQAMRNYLDHDGCRMQFLLEQLDDATASPCGKCDICRRRPGLEQPAERALVAAATSFLRHQHLEIKPRRLRAMGGSIPPAERLEAGRALSILGDGGWGGEVLRAKQAGEMFGEEVVDAAAELIREWRREPAPAAIVFVPTLDHDRAFVPNLAARLGQRLALPVLDAVAKQRPSRPQKLMENSAQQWHNIDGAYAINPTVALPLAPVLLVDDVVDSGWTMTLIGGLLRRAGCGPVRPFALAMQRG